MLSFSFYAQNGSVRFAENCLQRCKCIDNVLYCSNENYTCGEQELCDTSNGISNHECKCVDGYYGEEQKCIRAYECQDIYNASKDIGSGTYIIYPDEWPADPFQVYCEVHENGEVWTVSTCYTLVASRDG